ncbi:MAG: ATP-binding cassette domain-containing protein [Acidimicrobiia bacterium]
MTTPIIEADGVTKRFKETVALDDLSLAFEPGIVYGLLGPNGAGKTTLIRVLTTLIKPDQGRARVAGIDVVADPKGVRSRIGLAGQYAAVDEFLTGRENVEMVGHLYGLSRAETKRRADDVLERIDLVEASNRPVSTYSGGMRRRLDLAASMVGRPQVLFLDEPTTGIDPPNRLSLWDLIEDLVDEGTTLLLTTQYLEEADRLADRIGVIDHGRLIAEGTTDELKDQVGGDVIETKVHRHDHEAAIPALTSVCAGEPLVEGRTITIHAPDGAQTLTRAVLALEEAGVKPLDIGLRRPSLDDVFLTLTGHKAAERTNDGELVAAGRPGRRSNP